MSVAYCQFILCMWNNRKEITKAYDTRPVIVWRLTMSACQNDQHCRPTVQPSLLADNDGSCVAGLSDECMHVVAVSETCWHVLTG